MGESCAASMRAHLFGLRTSDSGPAAAPTWLGCRTGPVEVPACPRGTCSLAPARALRPLSPISALAPEHPLEVQPLQQVWRDHLLAGSLLLAGDFDRGRFVFLYPSRNERCHSAVANYAAALTDSTTFQTWTLEAVVDALKAAANGEWVQAFGSRHLGNTRPRV